MVAAHLGVSRRADAWAKEVQAHLKDILSTQSERKTGVSHRTGARLPGGLTADGPFSTIELEFDYGGAPGKARAESIEENDIPALDATFFSSLV